MSLDIKAKIAETKATTSKKIADLKAKIAEAKTSGKAKIDSLKAKAPAKAPKVAKASKVVAPKVSARGCSQDFRQGPQGPRQSLRNARKRIPGAVRFRTAPFLFQLPT
jgi:hypothetical protein